MVSLPSWTSFRERRQPQPGYARPRRRALLWFALVVLLAVAQTLLVWLTTRYENSRMQTRVEDAAQVAAGEVSQTLARDLQDLQALLWENPPISDWRSAAGELMRAHRTLLWLERRDGEFGILEHVDSPYLDPSLRMVVPRESLSAETHIACGNAQRLFGPAYSRSYFVPYANGLGVEVMDVCLPVQARGELIGTMVATYLLGPLMQESVSPELLRTHELTFVDSDRTRLARAGSAARGAGVYVAQRVIDLPGLSLQLRLDSVRGAPALIPNLATALVLGLSLVLGGVVALLVRDGRRRAAVERELAEALAFRAAMENSLVTGLRARDLQGRITYVNPAFCQMVGFDAGELLGRQTPPYWPPESVTEYANRQDERLAAGTSPPRDGFETTFMRKNGERFAAVVFEAPLLQADGTHTGWMSAVLDVSAQRRVEELSRQSQEKLQATARLATVGEMASLLSHELNQPLSAIAGYATGSLNLLASGGDLPEGDLRHALSRIAEQAERAGRVIKSVHDFVRRREHLHEGLQVDQLIDAVMPLVRLQARKSGTRVDVELPHPPLRIVCDRTMVEQVVLNLTRNAIQSMEDMPPERRQVTIAVSLRGEKWVEIAVHDRGHGIEQEVHAKLFTPFFSTRPEGMGLGLSLCRTVIEQHGGALDLTSTPQGSVFRFTVPAEKGAGRRRASTRATLTGATTA